MDSVVLFRQRPGPDWSPKASMLNFTGLPTMVASGPTTTGAALAVVRRWSRGASMGFRCSLTTVLRILGRLFPRLLRRGRVFLTAAQRLMVTMMDVGTVEWRNQKDGDSFF